MKINFIILFCILIFGSEFISFSASKFPAPEFETGYQLPNTVYPSARSDFFIFFDVIVLFLSLSTASYFAVKSRNRHGLYLLSVFSIIYFGFYRKGCVCSVGSLQNVILSFFNQNYILPFSVLLFFILPLLFALFFGRVFCSSVCPLGALQEIFIFKHIKLPRALKHILSLIPYLYLGLAVLFVATESGFIVCKYDPFVGFFRLSGRFDIILTGIGLLILGIFIARPFCRFLCPYGVILGFFSFFSNKHLSITPAKCIQCKLCENSCPNDAIKVPFSNLIKYDKYKEIRKVKITFLLILFILIIFGYSFSKTSNFFASKNKTVSLYEQVNKEERGIVTLTTIDSDAFRDEFITVDELFKKSQKIKNKFKQGTWLLGLFIGFIFSLKILSLLRKSKSDLYEPDPFNCISCGRCMEYCPVQDEGKK